MPSRFNVCGPSRCPECALGPPDKSGRSRSPNRRLHKAHQLLPQRSHRSVASKLGCEGHRDRSTASFTVSSMAVSASAEGPGEVARPLPCRDLLAEIRMMYLRSAFSGWKRCRRTRRTGSRHSPSASSRLRCAAGSTQVPSCCGVPKVIVSLSEANLCVVRHQLGFRDDHVVVRPRRFSSGGRPTVSTVRIAVHKWQGSGEPQGGARPAADRMDRRLGRAPAPAGRSRAARHHTPRRRTRIPAAGVRSRSME